MTGNRKDPKRTQPRTTAGERVDIAPVAIPIGKYWHAERSSIFGPKADTPTEWARSSVLPLSGYPGQYGLATVSSGGQTNVYGRDLDSGDWRPIGAQQILNEAGYPTGVYGLISITDLTFDGDVFIENMKLISWDNTPEHTAYQRAYDMDTGAGTDYAQAMAMAFPADGGMTVLDLGREAAVDSFPTAIDNESFALLETIDADTGNIAGSTASVDGKLPNWATAGVGQKTMAASVPVVMASDDAVLTALLETVRTAGGTTYSNIFGDCVCTYAGATTVNLLGLSFDPADNQILGLIQLSNASPAVKTVHYLGAFAYAVNIITVAGATFAATDTFIVWIAGQKKAFTLASNVERSEEIDDLATRWIPATLIDKTNITTNTTTYAYFDMSGTRGFTLQGLTSGAVPVDVLTVTVEATVQDDGTAMNACSYHDTTNAWFGVASWVDTDFWAEKVIPVAIKYVRVKYVTDNGGGSDADLTVFLRQIW